MDMDRLVEQLKRQEGLRTTPYLCPAGKLTIGYGRNLEERGVTEGEAGLLLVNDILEVAQQLMGRLFWFHELNDVRQNVLLNMAFNLGVSGLMKFKNMLAACEAGEFGRAAEEMLESRWAVQVGSRAVELAEQMFSGKLA